MMTRFMRSFAILVGIPLTLAACSIMSLQLGPLSEGEIRLKNMQLPETMQAGVSYDVAVNFEGDEQPVIKKVCFHWVAENTSISSPSLYCYTYEVQSNQPIGAVCPRWIADGPYTNISPLFCLNAEDIKFEGSGRFTVKIPGSAVRPEYNRLVGYVEYVRNGSVVETNKVSAKTIIEK